MKIRLLGSTDDNTYFTCRIMLPYEIINNKCAYADNYVNTSLEEISEHPNIFVWRLVEEAKIDQRVSTFKTLCFVEILAPSFVMNWSEK